MTNSEIKKLSEEYLMPNYGHFNVAFSHGKGAVWYDFDGKDYIDFTAGIGVNSLGFCDSGWVDAVTCQLGRLQHSSNLYYTQPAALLAKTLCERSDMGAVFFANSGAEANECAIKLARKYSSDKYGEGRGTVLSLINSFHGRTLATIKATGQEVFHKYFYPFPEGFKYCTAGDTQALKAALTDDVCAVIMEVIQGEGGVLPVPEEYVKQVRAVCDEKDVLLIIDEVQTGIGRTGKLFAFENYAVKPDVVTLAKGLGGGLPIGACLCKKELSGVMGAGTHGSTFGGNPVVCSGALKVLETIDEEFLGAVVEKGEYIRSKLKEMPEVAEIRGMGLMLGISLKTRSAKEIAAKALENGLTILTAKDSLRMLPPLNITYAEIDEGLERLAKTLE